MLYSRLFKYNSNKFGSSHQVKNVRCLLLLYYLTNKLNKMTKSELVEKWKNELELYKRVLNDPLMYTKEDRLRASGKALVIVSMLVDINELEKLE